MNEFSMHDGKTVEELAASCNAADLAVLAAGHYDLSGSHGWTTHIRAVLSRAVKMNGILPDARRQPIRSVAAVALYHDVTLAHGRRATHEVDGANYAALFLRGRLAPVELAKVVAAIREHRASFKGAFTSPLSEIVSAADRNAPEIGEPVRRAVAFRLEGGMTSMEEIAEAAAQHLREKYGRGGYARIPELYKQFWGAEYASFEDAMTALTGAEVRRIING